MAPVGWARRNMPGTGRQRGGAGANENLGQVGDTIDDVEKEWIRLRAGWPR